MNLPTSLIFTLPTHLLPPSPLSSTLLKPESRRPEIFRLPPPTLSLSFLPLLSSLLPPNLMKSLFLSPVESLSRSLSLALISLVFPSNQLAHSPKPFPHVFPFELTPFTSSPTPPPLPQTVVVVHPVLVTFRQQISPQSIHLILI